MRVDFITSRSPLARFLLICSLLLVYPACALDVAPVEIPDELSEFLGTECLHDVDCLDGQFCDAAKCQWFCSELHACPKDMWCDWSSNRCTTIPPGNRSDLKEVLGQPCRSQTDCPSDTVCMWLDGGMICTVDCASQRECSTIKKGACCLREMDGWYCAPADMCESADGDAETETDSHETESETDTPCQWDSYQCRDAQTVERCNSHGAWDLYKSCNDGSFCFKGVCVSGDDENCAGLAEFCCPDTMRCRGLYEVQICSAGTDWVLYRDCQTGTICSDGQCVPDGTQQLADGDSSDGDTDNPPEACDPDEGCAEEFQYCFVEHGRTEGTCRNYCDYPNENCPFGYACSYGTCEYIENYCESDGNCPSDRFCNKLPGQPYGICQEYCFNQGQYCPSESICDQDSYSVNYGRCVPTECRSCNIDSHCNSGELCNLYPGQSNGCCTTPCQRDQDCYGSLICCSDGVCGLDCDRPEACQDCPYPCDPHFGCIPTCPATCPEFECCGPDTNYVCQGICDCVTPLYCGVLMPPCCPWQTCTAITYGVLGFCI
jgi:hypothetical protein